MNEKVPSIFKKVKNGQFSLREVLLTPGQTYALQKAAAFFENFADKVEFVNNNFSDADLSQIIQSLVSVPQIKNLSILKNEFGEATMEALLQLFQKRSPNNLQELTIEGMQLKPTLCSNLMTHLNSASLRKLQLHQIGMREDSFSKFLQFLQKCQLEQLDVLDSRVTALQFLSMLEVLKSNRQLKYLNLGQNNLCAATASNEFKNFGNSTLETIAEEDAPSPMSPSKRPGGSRLAGENKPSKLSPHQQRLVEYLSVFIRANK